MSEPIYWPFSTALVSEWPGTRPPSWGSDHWGTDFAVAQGTRLRATVSGRIVRHNDDGLGAYVLDIIRSDGLLVRNGHLSAMYVVTGDYVRAGDVIGLTGGARGTAGAGASTGPHLHWELRWDRAWTGGNWVDPRNLNVKSFPDAKPPGPKPPNPAAPSPKPQPQGEDDMRKYIGQYIDGQQKDPYKNRCVIYDPASGFYTTWSGVPAEYTNGMAAQFATGSFTSITSKHWALVRESLDAVRAGK